MSAALLLGLFFFAPPLERGFDLDRLSGAPERVEVAAAPLVVHFWASWCEGCVEELPALARAAESCRDAQTRVLLVNAGESSAAVRAFSRPLGLSAHVLLDPKGAAWRRSGARGLPANWIWNGREGRLVEGPMRADEWRALLEGLGCRAR